jgi:hypothetical protein
VIDAFRYPKKPLNDIDQLFIGNTFCRNGFWDLDFASHRQKETDQAQGQTEGCREHGDTYR